MNLGIVSDTHMPRHARALPRALSAGLRAHNVAMILHCGDMIDEEYIVPLFEEIAPFDAVAGNNDPQSAWDRFGRRKIIDAGSVRIGMVHGDEGWRSTVENARRAFADEDVHAIIFGHSHEPYCRTHDGVWVVNPGSPTDKRRQAQYSFAILKIENETIAPSLHYYDDKS